jgi:maltooligosyltrehalose synthase
LTQVVLKLFAPGVPDIYQGTETWDLSLVDPDNRRPVDFDENEDLSKAEASSKGLLDAWTTGAVKQRILRAGLGLRRTLGARLEHADYAPLKVAGSLHEHVVAFARKHETGHVVVLGTRLSLNLLESEIPLVSAQHWGDTRILLPTGAGAFADILTGREFAGVAETKIAEVLRDLPVAVLSSR